MDIDSALEMWGRWARIRPHQGHCASIEWRYRSKLRPDMTPTGWGDWIPPVPMVPLPPMDSLQALAVERCMRHLPDCHRKALKLRYVLQMPKRMICLRLALNALDYDRFLGDARAMVAAVFTRNAKKGMLPLIRLPAPAENLAPDGR